jgi:predicted SAM-dependent methyltransferase
MILRGLDLIKKINLNKNGKLEFGCGQKKNSPNNTSIDIKDFSSVDIVGDIFDVLKLIEDNTIDYIESFHFFEHIKDLNKLLNECSRVLKNDKKMRIVVPHFSNPYYYSDPTHENFFGLYTFSYFSKKDYFTRKVPKYYDGMFNIFKIKLIFKTNKPKYIIYFFKKILQQIFNLNNFSKEFYEENLCYVFPCYEIDIILRNDKIFKMVAEEGFEPPTSRI